MDDKISGSLIKTKGRWFWSGIWSGCLHTFQITNKKEEFAEGDEKSRTFREKIFEQLREENKLS